MLTVARGAEGAKSIQSDTKYLRLDEDTPSDKEWTLLSAHFSRVENPLEDEGTLHELATC
jgi:hypothetical protein